MGMKQGSVNNISVFKEQLKRAIADYVEERTKGQVKYLALAENRVKNRGSIQQGTAEATPLSTYFGVKEYQHLSQLIVVTEREIPPRDIRDTVTLIYREMPKHFSFFFPIVELSDQIGELLTKYPRERLLEIELEEQRDQIQFRHNQVEDLRQKYQESIKLCESQSQKIKEIASVEKLDKVELVQKLNAAKFQCGEYQKVIHQQEKNLLVLAQQNQKLVTENQTLTQEVEKLLDINQKLRKSLQELQISYNELRSNYETCPIKNQQDLEQFEQKILQKIQQIQHAKAPEESNANASKGIGLFSVFLK